MLTSKTMKSQEIVDVMYSGDSVFKDDMSSLIKTRIPLFAVQAVEEKRLIQYMHHLSMVGKMRLYVWDMISGLIDISKMEEIEIPVSADKCCASEHERVLAYICREHRNIDNNKLIKYNKDGVKADIYILLDFEHVLNDPRIIRRLKDLTTIASVMSSIMVGHDIKAKILPEMSRMIPILYPPMPGNEEYKATLYEVANSAKQVLPYICDEAKDNEKEIIKFLRGKTIYEAQTFIAKNLVTYKHLLNTLKECKND